VLDDDNHRMARGKRYAVCDKTYNLYNKPPYREFFEFVDPLVEIPLAEAKLFDCLRTALRHPKETKGQEYKANSKCCDGGTCS
jgi:arsenite methyltransferase